MWARCAAGVGDLRPATMGERCPAGRAADNDGAMPLAPSFVPPCIPTRTAKPPAGPDWASTTDIGCRCGVRATRCACSQGVANDWSKRYPAIARTAAALRCTSFTIDGEAVVCGADGVALFNPLHRRGTVSEAMMYAFDLLELDAKDLRDMPLGEKRLARLLGRAARRDRVERAHRRGRRHDLPAGPPDRPGGSPA
jgi:hypothetical protein